MARPKRAGCTHIEVMTYEVEWYEKHGKYPDDRIKIDDLGHRYVEWDRAWNQNNRYRREYVQKILADYVSARVAGMTK